mmetsp:Transcript_29709/g.33114  ORF Transcript_29709/g.33114 Transcript_29709/m.33114 type:complete len:177 (+) Transcript_29709:51-581(+)
MPDKESTSKSIIVLMILTIISGLLIIATSIPYWILIALIATEDNRDNDVEDYVIASLNGVLLFLLGAAGIYGAITKGKQWLICFGAANIISWVFGYVQLVCYYAAFKECQDEQKLESSLIGLFDRPCDPEVDDLWLWIPALVLIIVNILAFFAAFCMFSCIGSEEEDPRLKEGFYD